MEAACSSEKSCSACVAMWTRCEHSDNCNPDSEDIDCFPFGQYYKYFPPPHKVEQSAAGSVNSPVCHVIPGGAV